MLFRSRDHFLGLAELAKAEWFGPNQSRWSARLREEHADLRAALEFCAGGGRDGVRGGLRLALALEPYWMACGQQREGRHWLGRLLPDAPSAPERTAALWLSGFLAALTGDGDTALELLRQYEQTDPEATDPATFAHATYVTGLALVGSDPARALGYLEEGVRLERALAARDRGVRDVHLPLAMANLGLGLCFAGDLDRAVAMLLEGRTLCEDGGERWVRASTVQLLGLAEWLRGDPARAHATLREALRQKHALGDLLGIALTVEFLAWSTETVGDPASSARLLGASSVLWEPLGKFLVGMHTFLGRHEECATRLGSSMEAFRAAFEAGREMEVEEVVADALGDPVRTVPAPGGDPSPLTRREHQVALLLGDGRSNREISDALVIAPRTVDTHVANIFTKLGFSSRAQVAAWIAERRRVGEIRDGVRSSPDPSG